MLRRRKHGTTGRLALPHQNRQKGEIAETVRSAPGRDPRMARFIRIFERAGKASCGVKALESVAILIYLFVYHTNRWTRGKNGPQVRPDSSRNAGRRSQARRPCDPLGRAPDAVAPARRRQPACSRNEALPAPRFRTSRRPRTRFRARSPITSAPRKRCSSKPPAATCCTWRARPNRPHCRPRRRGNTPAHWSRRSRRRIRSPSLPKR